jgi:hypothetical protein
MLFRNSGPRVNDSVQVPQVDRQTALRRTRDISFVCLLLVLLLSSGQTLRADFYGWCNSWMDTGGRGACLSEFGDIEELSNGFYDTLCGESCSCYCGFLEILADGLCGGIDRDCSVGCGQYGAPCYDTSECCTGYWCAEGQCIPQI